MYSNKIKLTQEQEKQLNEEKERGLRDLGVDPKKTEEMFYNRLKGQQSFSSQVERLFGELAGAAEAAGGGLAKAVGDGSKSVGEAVENYNAEMNAKRHSKTLQNPRLSPDAILQTLGQLNGIYKRTELSPELTDQVHRMMEEAMEKPRLSELFGKKRDEFLKKMRDAGMPEEIIAKLEQQTFGRTSSSSSAISSLGSSGSVQSEDARTPEGSIDSTARVVVQLCKKPDDKQGPLDSPPSLLPSEYQDLEESKKTPQTIPSLRCRLKKTFSSCYSLLSNVSSLRKALSQQTPKDRGYSQVTEEPRKPQASRQRSEEPKKPKESFFAAFRSGVKNLRGKLPEYPNYLVFGTKSKGRGWKERIAVPVRGPNYDEMGQFGGAVVQKSQSIAGGVGTVLATTAWLGYMAGNYAASITMEDLRPGPNATFAASAGAGGLAGIGGAIVAGVGAAASAMKPSKVASTLRGVRGALPDLPSRNDFRVATIKAPNLGKWADRVRSSLPSMETMRGVGGAIYENSPSLPRSLPRPGVWSR